MRFRWNATAGAIATVLIGLATLGATPARSLERDEVSRRLGAVPIFTIVRDNGQPLVLFPQQQDRPAPENGVIFNFFDPDDVQAFVQQLQERNPEAMATTTILVSSLGEMYEWPDRNGNAEKLPRLIYNPIEEEVTAATNLLREQGQTTEQFPGIPLFVATGASENDYLTLEEDGRKVVPFFFSRADLDRMLETYQRQQPDVASQARVKVTSLDRVVSILEEGQSADEFINRIRLIPARESLAFIQSIQQEGNRGAAPTAPSGNGANGASTLLQP